MAALAELGIDFEAITDELLVQAVEAFEQAFSSLLDSVADHCRPR